MIHISNVACFRILLFAYIYYSKFDKDHFLSIKICIVNVQIHGRVCTPYIAYCLPGGGGGGGGGYSNFFRIRRLGPSIYRSPQKNIRNFKHPKKVFEILVTQKNIPILYLDLKKDPNCIEMTLKVAQFCEDPKEISTKSSYPQKYPFFWKPKKILKFRILNRKNGPSLYVWKYQSAPLGLFWAATRMHCSTHESVHFAHFVNELMHPQNFA